MLFDVARIIITYLTPDKLVLFFLEHRIDLRIRFKYDVSCEALYVDKFNRIFDMFPNIIIMGIFLKNPYSHNIFDGIRMECNGLRCVKIINNTNIDIDIAELTKCINLRILEICGGKCFNVEKIYDFNLYYLRLPFDGDYLYDLGRIASNMPRLRHINIPFGNSSELVRFRNLQSIAFSDRICCEKDIIVLGQLEGLKCVKFVDCRLDELLDLSKCCNLRSLQLISCGRVNIIDGFAKLTKLQHVYISCCHDLISILSLERCINLVSIELKFCMKLRNANVLAGHEEKIICCPLLIK